MASSAENPQMAPTPCGVTAAPPPTPSAQPNSTSTSDAADALSRLLHRLPPILSLPSRLSPRTTSPPSVAFSQDNPNFLSSILSYSSTSSQLGGFFQLTNHNIPSKLAVSAEQEALSLLNLTANEKHQLFSDIWPLSFDYHDDGEEDGEDGNGESFCFDTSCSTESTQSLSSLKEFAHSLEKVGLETIKALSHAVGFENPLGEDGAASSRLSSLMWISEGVPGNNPGFSGRFYPYIIALQYQIRCRKYSLLADSGWVPVSPQVDSVLVTIGDIAQVWSNGKLKKVRGRPTAVSVAGESTRCISMSLLLTLPTDSTASDNFLHPAPALVPATANTNDTTGEVRSGTDCKSDHEDDQDSRNSEMISMDNSSTGSSERIAEDKRLFSSFSFEDYTWRVYHERLPFKDPLDRYRLSDD
ncbi:hypothetical protein MKW98_027119 [Papaver atlanticum]|uniref:Isopenicillin N synthase-like Fe(2+) 2OG dioxygenase domain-containing protein n=1 Tax=Papaver atlanticum TaxID=357466 RepID=A0AAD4SH56_9MAGN|nr:hypothetical protein MKW98_027119 [Papaver atlanticum]